MYINQSLKKYLDDLAARQPTPGGGSAAACSGALAAALVSMVLNFTMGNPKYRGFEEELKKQYQNCENLRLRFMELIDLDILSYEKVYKAKELPRTTPEEKTKRKQILQNTLREAVAIPMEICQSAHLGLRLCNSLIDKSNINLISDLAVAAELFRASFSGGLINIEINIGQVKDENFIIEVRKVLEPLEDEVGVLGQHILDEVRTKMLSK